MAEDPCPSGGAGFEVAVSVACPGWRSRAPDAEALCRQAAGGVLALAGPRDAPVEVSVVLAGDELLRRLNRESRGVDRPTDVLAFPCDSPGEPVPAGAPRMLGDVVISGDTLARRAGRHGAPFADRLRHLVVHGTLHLLGYRHGSEAEAGVMEGLESAVLAGMGVPDPYADGAAPAGEAA